MSGYKKCRACKREVRTGISEMSVPCHGLCLRHLTPITSHFILQDESIERQSISIHKAKPASVLAHSFSRYQRQYSCLLKFYHSFNTDESLDLLLFLRNTTLTLNSDFYSLWLLSDIT